MVCHYNFLARDLSVPFEKNWTSSGNRRPCTKVWATHPLSPWAHVLMLADTGRGLLPSLKVACQPASNREEDATLASTWAVGSRVVIPPDNRPGGGGPWGRIPWACRRLLGYALSLLRAARGSKRRSWVYTPRLLLLWGWPSAGHEAASGHHSSSHHLVLVRVRFSSWGVYGFYCC